MSRLFKIWQIIFAITLVMVQLSYFAPVAHAQLDPNKASDTAVIPYQGRGVENTIKEFLCTPEDGDPSLVLYTCINKLYRFGITAGGIMLVFFVVVAGYFYITGGEQSKSKGKAIFTASLTGLGILLFSYVLLRFLNPQLVIFKTIQPPIFDAAKLPNCADVGLGKDCILDDGKINRGDSKGIINGYNISSYATDPTHEEKIANIYNVQLKDLDINNAEAIDKYLKEFGKKVGGKDIPVTGAMIVASAKQFNIDGKLLMALMQQDSGYGINGKGARTHNPGNVGNDDAGNLKDWGTWPAGVDAVARWLSKHKV